MSDASDRTEVAPGGPVVVTGANGFVGARVVRELADRGVAVRALVRREGTAPTGPDVTEHVGDFTDPDDAADVLAGASAAVTTVAPLRADRDTQHRVSVEGSRRFAEVAVAQGVPMLVHVSTAAVYDRSPGVGDVDEDGELVDDDAGAYPVTKRDADAELADLDGSTRVLVRPPAILGPGPTSTWNTVRPRAIRDDPDSARRDPDQTLAWVHVDDLARLLADLATGEIPAADDVATGPVRGDVTAVNVAAPDASWRDWYGTVASAVGVEPAWSEEPGWEGRLVTTRVQGWGWQPRVNLREALEELVDGLSDLGDDPGSDGDDAYEWS